MLAVPLDPVADLGSLLMRVDHDSAVIAGPHVPRERALLEIYQQVILAPDLVGHPGHPRAFGLRVRPICQGTWPTGIKYRTV